jgi:molecular chaperone GrpE
MTEKDKQEQEEPKPEAQAAEIPVPEAAPAAAEEPPDPVATLRAELEQAKAQACEFLDGWKRAQADLINYRKRVERDAEEVKVFAAGRIAARWFPVLDDLERALKEWAAAPDPSQWAEGVELIYRKGIAALEAEGITLIEPAEGTTFDPNEHEAVAREIRPDRQDGEILEVVHRGYRMGDRVLRPAQVRVACKPEANTQ